MANRSENRSGNDAEITEFIGKQQTPPKPPPKTLTPEQLQSRFDMEGLQILCTTEQLQVINGIIAERDLTLSDLGNILNPYQFDICCRVIVIDTLSSFSRAPAS